MYKNIKFSTYVIPTQIFLLVPKGMMLKFWMFRFQLSLFNMCWGSHFSRVDHTFGLILIPNTLIKACVHQHIMHLKTNTFGSWIFFINLLCCNLSLGLVTKARACEGACQEWNLGITFHVPKSLEKCEGMNPHTPKWALILGVEVSMDSWISKGRLQGSKLIRLNSSLYH